MKSLLLLLLLTSTLFAQTTEAERWRQTKTGWREVAQTTDKPVTYWFYRTFARRGNDVEVWLKMYEPEKSMKIAKMVPKSKRQYSHQMQFTTFHCGSQRVSMNDSIVYDTLGSILGVGSFAMSREPVPPESVFAIMYRHFCVTTQYQQ